jgi:hypothetical protein
MSEVPVLTAIFLVVLSGLHATFGGLLLQVLSRRVLTPPEFIGFGFALGSLVALCVDQLFVNTFMRDWSWILLLIAGSLLLAVNSHLHKMIRADRNNGQTAELTFLSLFVLTFLLLVQERYWPLVIVVVVTPFAVWTQRLIAEQRSRTRATEIANFTGITVAIAVSFWVITNRPRLWWIKTQDFQFFEALSFSLAHFGFRDQVFVAGYPVSYHWFSYGWIGLLSRISHADRWVVLTRAAPVLVVIAILLIVIAILTHFNLKGVPLMLSLGIFGTLNDFNFESFSMIHSYIWLLSAVWLLVSRSVSQGAIQLILVPLLVAGAYGAKSSNLPVILSSLGIVFLLAIYRRNASLVSMGASLLANFMALGIVHYFLYADSSYSRTVQIGTIGIARNLFGDITVLSRPKLIIASVLVLVNLTALHIWGVCRRALQPGRLNDPITIASIAAAIGGIAPLLVIWSEDYELEEYFLHSMTIFTSIAVAATAIQLALGTSNQFTRLRYWSVIVGTGFVTMAWLNRSLTNEGTEWAIFSRILGSSTVLLSLSVALFAFLIVRTFGINVRLLGSHMFVVVCCVSIVSLNERWFNDYATFVREIESPNHETFMLGSPDVIDGARLIRDSTEATDVIASNYFCEQALCPLSEYGASRIDWRRGGEAMTLALYSERRFWVSGYGFLWQNAAPPIDIRRRIGSSLTSPPPSSGVAYFLRDKTMPCTCEASWVSVGETERFELFRL